MTPVRYTFPVLRLPFALLLALLCAAPLACEREPATPPSVVFILIDTLRADYLGCYGFDGPISPNVDRIAETAYVFEQGYATAPWTKPSIASLFTSLYPLVHQVTNHDGRWWGEGSSEVEKGVLPERATTLAEALGARGYTTAAFVANPWITAEYGFAQGFDTFNAEGFYPPATKILERAMAWLDTAPVDPLFLYLHFMDVHGPYRASEPGVASLARSASVRSDITLDDTAYEAIPAYLRKPPWASRPEARRLETWRARYGGGMLDLDAMLGLLLDRLERDGRLADSWIVITSDHGEELYEHGGWNHGQTLFEEQIRVPLILRPPGGLSARRTITSTVSLMDLLPTLVRIAGGTAPPGIHGEDLAPLLTGETRERFNVSTATTEGPELASLRAGSYKLVLDQASGAARLFDLAEDPGEQEDLAPGNPELTQRLEAVLRETVARVAQGGAFEAGSVEETEARREVLKSLGYID